MPGRHKEGGSIYYPVMLKPDIPVNGSNHDDVNPEHFVASAETYIQNLAKVLLSRNGTQYKRNRLETGISKPSIFLGLPAGRTLGIPKCFGSDVMHLLSLNLPDILIPLWRGTLDCDPDDDKSTWDWATLSNSRIWKAHGERVAAAIVDIPGVFGRPPRNPAEKINSGYKAWEFHLYLWGLGPGLLHDIIPPQYWRSFSRLARAVRLITQHSIGREELKEANHPFIEFTREFEDLYYQRRIDWIHFVRQSIHALTHYGHEVETKGPLICASQWTMERTIGNLTKELRQHSQCYANLTQRAIRRARVNALKMVMPSLDPHAKTFANPRGPYEISGGYVLLPKHERSRRETTALESTRIIDWIKKYAPLSPDLKFIGRDQRLKIRRWDRMALPNGQKCRALCCKWEQRRDARKCRNVKVYFFGTVSVVLLVIYNFSFVSMTPSSLVSSIISSRVNHKPMPRPLPLHSFLYILVPTSVHLKNPAVHFTHASTLDPTRLLLFPRHRLDKLLL